MWCEDLVVAFCFLLLSVERSKKLWGFWHGVVGPLLITLDEERVAYKTSVLDCWGSSDSFSGGDGPYMTGADGFAWDFDATMGFPGEDIRLL